MGPSSIANKIKESREQGYSDEEIVQAASQHDPEFAEKYVASVQAGHSPSEILNFLSPESARMSIASQEKEPTASEVFAHSGLLPGKGFATGAIKGLGLKRLLPEEEQEPKEGELPGRLTGEAIKYGSIAKALGPLTNTVLAPLGTAGLITEAGLVGAGGGALTKLLEEGELPTSKETALEYAIGAGVGAAGKLIGSGVKKAKEFFKPSGKAPLENITQTPYEVSKAAQEAIEKPIKPGAFQEIHTTQPSKPESLRGRVSRGGQAFGINVRATPRHPNTEQSILQAFPYEIHSSRNGGQLATNLIRQADESGYQAVNEAYEISRVLNEHVHAVDPQLAQRLQQRISMVDNSLLPTGVQEGLRKDAQQLFDRLAVRNEAGQLNYRPVSNQQIIDTIQNIHHKMKFEFEHGEASNIYNLLLSDLEDALARRSLIAGEEAAVQANRNARDLYRSWAEEFNTPAARRFRNINKDDFEARFNFLKKSDNFIELRPILERSQEGRELIGAIQADIVEKELGQFMKNPRALTQRQLERKLRELSETLSERQVEHIREVFNRERAVFNRRVREQPTIAKQEKQREALTKKAAKDAGIEPEKFWKEMDSRSGIQKVRNELRNKPTEYNAIRDVKAREIIYGGKTTPGSGREMAERLRVSKNKDLMIELYSEKEYNDLLKALDDIGDKEAKKEMIKKALIKIGVATGTISKYSVLLL